MYLNILTRKALLNAMYHVNLSNQKSKLDNQTARGISIKYFGFIAAIHPTRRR